MKKHIFNGFVLLTFAVLLFQACDVAYKYDIENGFADHIADSANVTISESLGIDRSMYDQARIFPGLPDTLTERRIDTTLMFDMRLKYVDADEMRIQHVPQPVYSTGLYAGAGELITIIVDDDVMGLTVQIGSHTENLGTTSMTRSPVVYTKKALYPGENIVRNPFGGYIWIVRNGNTRGVSDQLKVYVSGAYRAPDFVMDITEPAQWAEQIKNTTVPWLEIRSRRVAFSVPRLYIESMIKDNPAFVASLPETLYRWDNILEEFFYKYFALEDGATDDMLRTPDYPERVVLDVQLVNNVLTRLEGQPLMALSSMYMAEELTDWYMVAGGLSTTVLVSLSNNHTPLRSPFWSSVSSAAKVIPQYRVTERGFHDGIVPAMSDIFTGEGAGVNENFPKALSFAKADSSKNVSGITAYNLLLLTQLANYKDNNWAFYTEQFLAQKNAGGYLVTTYSSLGTFYSSLCAYFNVNFAPFFDQWGYSLPDKVRRQADEAYPLLDKTIWEYNPMNKANPSTDVTDWTGIYRYRHDRSSWTAVALDGNFDDNYYSTSSNPEYQAPSKAIDADKATYWHCYYSPSAPLPHYFIVDMQEKRAIDGFYIANGGASRRLRRAYIEIYDGNDEINMNDQNIQWRRVAHVRPFWEINDSSVDKSNDGLKENLGLHGRFYNERFFDFTAQVTCRYLRIVMPEWSFNDQGWDSNGIKPDASEPGSGNRFNSLGEFGTYSYTK